MLLQHRHRFLCAAHRRIGRHLEGADIIALILFGEEGGGQAEESEGEQCDDYREAGHHAAAALEQLGHPALIAIGHRVEFAIEPAEEALLLLMTMHWLEQRGAERRRQRKGEESGEEDRDRHGDAELAIDRAGRTAGEGHWDEHGDEHKRDADDGGRYFRHRLARGLQRGEPFLCHDALDVLHYDDRVIDDDADRQHHAKHGEHVDRETRHEHHGEGA